MRLSKFILITLVLIFCFAGSDDYYQQDTGATGPSGDNCVGGETMGWTQAETTSELIATENLTLVMGQFVAPCTGQLDAAFAYGDGTTDNATVAVFNANSAAPPDSGDTAVGISNVIAGDTGLDWETNTFISGSVVKNNSYYITLTGGNVSFEIKYDTDAGSLFTDYDSTCSMYASLPSEITNSAECDFPTDDGRQYSLYVTLKAP
ncbi:MAG: hypothetical protein ACU83N_15845 [Gammaproteobacteria bacterium]